MNVELIIFAIHHFYFNFHIVKVYHIEFTRNSMFYDFKKTENQQKKTNLKILSF
jgi:hypothetical protein